MFCVLIIIICVCLLQVVPKITEGNTAYVHHMVIYQCLELNHTVVGQSAECDSAHVEIQECRGGDIIGVWAVGGTVSQCVHMHS